ncbi:hypothetical protein CAPTEDRAFT_209875 [Capitella teleta]|uniref:Uncharacterized protein n=1 Tax=Capitella teleta TaxID=283909 RepID=R7UWX0_CAPTE|nr:hypothetical protein CAPTEDRAFT_209875 [Capitella teleta]|eukprot:ELU07906.1 hypothetical protein CAPTEDRAFT_209875 [Capitella teleta]
MGDNACMKDVQMPYCCSSIYLRFHCNYCSSNITKLGCGGLNTNKTVCNSLLELMTVSAQSGFNSRGFNNSMHRYLPKKVLMKSDIAVGEAHRLTRFHSLYGRITKRTDYMTAD